MRIKLLVAASLMAFSSVSVFSAMPSPDIGGLKIGSSINEFKEVAPSIDNYSKVDVFKGQDGILKGVAQGKYTQTNRGGSYNSLTVETDQDGKIWVMKRIVNVEKDNPITLDTLIKSLSEKYGSINADSIKSCMNAYTPTCVANWVYDRKGNKINWSNFTRSENNKFPTCFEEINGLGGSQSTVFHTVTNDCGMAISVSIVKESGYVKQYTTMIIDPRSTYDNLSAKKNKQNAVNQADYEKAKANKPSL